MELIFLLVALAILGAVFGSFANVVIWRLPRGESLSHPPSHCPQCGHDIVWFDNIPMVSWVLLRGRCRDCRGPIAVRYPLVEATSAASWAVAGLRFGLSAVTGWAIALFYLLLILSFIDLDTRRLPNVLVGTLAVVGIVGVVLSQVTGIVAVPLVGVDLSGVLASPGINALLGVVLGAGVALVIALVYQAVRRHSGMGLGDVKLLGALGVFLGPLVLLAFFAAALLGSVVGVVALVAARPSAMEPEAAVAGPDTESAEEATEDATSADEDIAISSPASLPFGPFLALGTVIVVLWGPQVVMAYLRLVGIG